MKKLIIRADDLGFSKGINYGIFEAVKSGIIKSVGFMVNMPDSKHGWDLIKDMNVCLGQHTNICVGTPITDPKLIPSLCDENGQFKSSKMYRAAFAKGEDFVVLEEVVMEIEAQYHRFVELTGRQPHYFEGHAVESNTFFEGLSIVAKKYNLDYQPFNTENTTFRNTKLNVVMDSTGPYKDAYDPFLSLQKAVKDYPENECGLLICHPGFMDTYIMSVSSLTMNRCKEVDMCLDSKIKDWIKENQVSLLTYDDLI